MDLRGFAATAALVFFSVVSSAQQNLPVTDITDSAVDDVGSRHSTRPTETIPEDELKIQQRPELDDALNGLPGVQTRLNGGPLLSIRGSQSSARALVLEEGIPLNFSDGVGFNPLFVATENLSSATLLKGAASSLFGHDAMAGVLEFKTEKLKSPKFYGDYGSFNTSGIFAGTPVPAGSTKIQVTAFETHSDNNYPYSIPRVGLSGTQAHDDQQTAHATLEAQNTSNDGFQWKTFNLVAQQIGTTPGSAESPNFPTAYNSWGEISGLTTSSKLSEKFSLGTRTSFKYLYQNYIGSSPGTTWGYREGVSLTDKIGESQLEAFDDYDLEQFQASYLISNPQSVTINEGGIAGLTPLNTSTTLSAALRVSTENSTITPSVGIETVTPEQWKYFANYAEGYHPASVTQKYSRFAGTPATVGNPNLQDEHSYEFDLGFEKKFGEVNTNFEAFDRSITNLIQNQLVGGFVTPENVGRGSAQGFELTARWSGDVDVEATVGYLSNVEVDTGNPVPLSPSVQAHLSLRKNLWGGTFEFQDTYWSSYYDNDFITGTLVSLNSWNTLDFFAEYVLFDQTRLKISVLNIFNQPRELAAGYPEPQASYLATLESYL